MDKVTAMQRPSRVRFWLGCGVLSLCLFGSNSRAADAPEKHVQWSISAGDPFSELNRRDRPADFKLEVRRGEVIRLDLNGKLAPEWHTYPIHKTAAANSAAQMSKVTVTSKQFAVIRPAAESEPELVDEKDIGKQYQYTSSFTFTVDVLVRPDAPANETLQLEILVTQLVCNNTCITERTTLSLPVSVSSADPLPLTPAVAEGLKKFDDSVRDNGSRSVGEKPAPGPTSSFNWQDLEIEEADEVVGEEKTSGLWATIIKAIVAGFISLVTPCVFPMIPVTVSIFLKRREASGPRPLTMAVVYCGTIVTVMTVGGIALVSVLAAVSQHWITNVFLTGIFVFFALSLLGMYEIQLPSSLANLTGSKQGQSGLVGIVFMALTFSIISFACVGPIYGGFITLEASGGGGNWLARVLGPLAFSLAFASPFFLLALFPSLLKSMPKSGSWMNSVKVVMGFLELAAAFKFIRAAEMNFFHKSEYFTFDLCLAAYIVLSLACGLYLLNLYRLPHDHEVPESVGVGRLMVSLFFLTIGLYLLPGLFKDERERSQRVRGVTYQWVRAFLLPDDPSDWGADLGAAIAQARQENKPIFIDFTGVGCNNCKLNEDNIFARPKIQQAFADFVTVRLFVAPAPDGLKQVPEGEGATKLRDEKFKNYALPYYVILKPTGEKKLKKIAYFEKGVINDADEFADFLRKALLASAKVKGT